MRRIELKVTPELETAVHRYMALLKYYLAIEVTFTDAIKLLFAEATFTKTELSPRKPKIKDVHAVNAYMENLIELEKSLIRPGKK